MKTISTLLLAVSFIAAPAISAEDQPKNQALFHWEVSFESGKTSVTSPAGELAYLTVENGQAYAIAASLENENSQAVTFRILTVKNVPGAGEMLKQVEKFSLLPGASYSTAWKPTLTFHLNKVTRASAGNKPTPPSGTVRPNESSSLIGWEVKTPSKKSVQFVSRNGEMARIELPSGGAWEITPSIRDGNRVAFQLLNVENRKPDHFTLAVGGQHQVDALLGFQVKLTSIRPPK